MLEKIFLKFLLFLFVGSCFAKEEINKEVVEVGIPVPKVNISAVSCDVEGAIIKICNDGFSENKSKYESVFVNGFVESILIEQERSELFQPQNLKQDSALEEDFFDSEYTPRPTPVGRMETDLLGKYRVPKNLPFTSEKNEVSAGECLEVFVSSLVDERSEEFSKTPFSCDVSISADISSYSGSSLNQKIYFIDKEEFDEER